MTLFMCCLQCPWEGNVRQAAKARFQGILVYKCPFCGGFEYEIETGPLDDAMPWLLQENLKLN